MTRFKICGVAVVLLGTVVLADKPFPNPPSLAPKSSIALDAIHHADDAVKAIQTSCRKQIASTRETEAAQLQEALIGATKAGDLDEALRIRAAVQSAQSEARKSKLDLDQMFVGIWRFHDNPTNGYILIGDGTARLTFTPTGKATWSIRKNEVIIDWGEGAEDGFKLEDGIRGCLDGVRDRIQLDDVCLCHVCRSNRSNI